MNISNIYEKKHKEIEGSMSQDRIGIFMMGFQEGLEYNQTKGEKMGIETETNSTSRYLKKFKQLQTEEAKSLYKLQGNRVLIEVLPPREIKTASGLILTAPKDHVKVTAESQQHLLGIVLMTGQGYVDSDNNPIPMDVEVGNLVMINELGLKYFSTFPGIADYTRNTLALTSEADIQMVFPNEQSFEKYESLLNE